MPAFVWVGALSELVSGIALTSVSYVRRTTWRICSSAETNHTHTIFDKIHKRAGYTHTDTTQ